MPSPCYAPQPIKESGIATPRPGNEAPLAAGERVVLHDRRQRRYLLTLSAGQQWHSHSGLLEHDSLIGASEGSQHRTTQGMAVTVLRPTREDLTLKAPRRAQVVYRKDQAAIVGLGDIVPGCEVIEAGAGSGALTIALLDAVGPNGSVTSFEVRSDHLEQAVRNVTAAVGDSAPWEHIKQDVIEGAVDRRCDRLVLDLLEPWEVVRALPETLRPGGVLVAYMPTIPQVMRLAEVLDAHDTYGLTRTVEVLQREWHVDGLAVRPDHRMVAHTAFITVSRRLAATGPDGA